MQQLRHQSALRAPLTILAYASDMKMFQQWCTGQACSALPAATEDVCRYILDQLNTGRKVTTVGRYATAIVAAHRDAGLEAPSLAAVQVLITAAKRLRREQPVQKEPVMLEQLRALAAGTSGPGALDARNRALLLFGFASALRRSNLAALDLADVEFTARGLVVSVRSEKQDQFGVGRKLGIPPGNHPETCALSALLDWLRHRGMNPGPLFQQIKNNAATGLRLHPARVAKVVQAQMKTLGLDPAIYGGHSLRSGFVTAAVEANVQTLVIMETTGHRSVETLRRYYRSRDPLRACAGGQIDL
jgi:integrase